MTKKTFPPLYKYTAKEGTQLWEIWVEPRTDPALYGTTTVGVMVTRYGLVGGKKQTIEEVVALGKNVGKKNETTPYAQACAEAESRWEKQKTRKGYGLTAGESKATRAVMPMLAQVYEKHKQKVGWESAWAQPKFDGFRCLAHLDGRGGVELVSRENQPLKIPHLAEILRGIGGPAVILDGELYCHGMSLPQISSACKKVSDKTAKIQYHVYDAVLEGSNFTTRTTFVRQIVEGLRSEFVRDVRTIKVRSEADLLVCQQEFLGDGYEGAMLRHGSGPYEAGKRSASLLKVKKFEDAEFKVVDWKLGRGKMAAVPVFTCLTGDGHPFDVLAPGDMEEKRALGAVAGACVGKLLTVKYLYMTKTDKPVPYLPIAKCFRDGNPLE